MKCLDCCCGSFAEVRLCEVRKCPLWRFRMGREVLPDSTGDAEAFPPEQAGQAPVPPRKETVEK